MEEDRKAEGSRARIPGNRGRAPPAREEEGESKDKVGELKKEVDKLRSEVDRVVRPKDKEDELILGGIKKCPFIEDILEASMPHKFKMPHIKTYQGNSDLHKHLESYSMVMQLHRVLDAILCRAFPTTLKGTARAWYHQLGVLTNYPELLLSTLSDADEQRNNPNT